jgi:hypothetical protein
MRAILVLALLACLSAMPFSPSYAANEAKEGETCDGIAVIKCDKGLLCEHPAGQCQVIDGAGTCVKNTEVCDEPVIPVCACGGKEFPADCERKKAKQQLDYAIGLQEVGAAAPDRLRT